MFRDEGAKLRCHRYPDRTLRSLNLSSISDMNESAYSVEVPGLDPGLHSNAKKDIRDLVTIIEKYANSLNVPFILDLIRVTAQFEQDVNRIFQSRSSFVGYAAARSNVQAIGKTLWTRNAHGDIGFVVVLDAKFLVPWSFNNPLCLTTLLHELVHVLCEVRHLQRLGEVEYTAEGDTRERWLDRWASSILDEFDVDCLVDAIVRNRVTNNYGKTWSLRQLDEALGLNYPNSLLDGFRGMPQTIEETVRRYRYREMSTSDLMATLVPYVNDLLVLLSHAASRYVETAQWTELVSRIKETDASRRFLREHLDVLLGQFEEPQRRIEDSVRIVADAVEGIFRNCGLRFETTSRGVYMSVDQPQK